MHMHMQVFDFGRGRVCPYMGSLGDEEVKIQGNLVVCMIPNYMVIRSHDGCLKVQGFHFHFH